MLLPVTECISQSRWLWFSQRPQKLINFQTFDEASRGPWGALQLLIRMRGRTILASAGGFTVLAAMAVDPFTQQVLSYPPIPTKSPGNSSIGRVQTWAGDSEESFISPCT